MSNTAAASLGSRLREARQAAGLSQEAFAETLGVARATLGAYEADRNEPGLSLFGKLNSAGHDAVYVTVGMRSPTFAAANVDWPLAIEMAAVVSAWAQRRERIPTLEEQAAILQAAYGWGVGGDRTAAQHALNVMLNAA